MYKYFLVLYELVHECIMGTGTDNTQGRVHLAHVIHIIATKQIYFMQNKTISNFYSNIFHSFSVL